MDNTIQERFFTYRERLNRQPYLLRNIILWLINVIAAFFLDQDMSLLVIVGGIISIVAGVSNIMLTIRRLHDMNKSGWWFLLFFIPIVNVIFYLYVYLKKGTTGPNDYGPDPLDGGY